MAPVVNAIFPKEARGFSPTGFKPDPKAPREGHHNPCSLMATIKFLKPGETYVQSFTWSGYGFEGPADQPMKLRPGTHLIRSLWSDDKVEGHPVTFQIVN